MTTAIHRKTGRTLTIHTYQDGMARLVPYVVGDKDWKKVDRQLRVSINQALATAKLGEIYIAMNDGSGSRRLYHSRELDFT